MDEKPLMRFQSENTVVQFLRHGVNGVLVTKRIFWCCVANKANKKCFGVSEHTAIAWDQSLFFTKIRGKERKPGKRASVSVSVTFEQCSFEPLAAQASQD